MGALGSTGTLGYLGITGYGTPSGATGFQGPTGITGSFGPTGSHTGLTGPIGTNGVFLNVPPTQFVINDEMSTTRQLFTRNIQSNMYVTDSPNSIIARTNGFTTNDIVYTFGKSHSPTYTAIGGSGSTYGTQWSRNLKQWSPLSNTSSNVPCRIVWDGLKWIVTQNSNTLLVSYVDISYAQVNVSSVILSSIAYNSNMYVGIGIGGIFYSYDGLNWYISTTGTAAINNTSASQIGKVVWNGNMWVAVGNGVSYTIAYSYDGINWTGVAGSKTLFDGSGGAIDVVWDGSKFVAVGANSLTKYIVVSTDGINWSNSGIQYI